MQNLNAGTVPFWKIDVVVKFHGPTTHVIFGQPMLFLGKSDWPDWFDFEPK